MGLQTRMFLLIAVMFAVLYGVITLVGTLMGMGSALVYIIIALGFILLQYLISPAIVGWTMKVKWVTEQEEPELHKMVAELAQAGTLAQTKSWHISDQCAQCLRLWTDAKRRTDLCNSRHSESYLIGMN